MIDLKSSPYLVLNLSTTYSSGSLKSSCF